MPNELSQEEKKYAKSIVAHLVARKFLLNDPKDVDENNLRRFWHALVRLRLYYRHVDNVSWVEKIQALGYTLKHLHLLQDVVVDPRLQRLPHANVIDLIVSHIQPQYLTTAEGRNETMRIVNKHWRKDDALVLYNKLHPLLSAEEQKLASDLRVRIIVDKLLTPFSLALERGHTHDSTMYYMTRDALKKIDTSALSDNDIETILSQLSKTIATFPTSWKLITEKLKTRSDTALFII